MSQIPPLRKPSTAQVSTQPHRRSHDHAIEPLVPRQSAKFGTAEHVLLMDADYNTDSSERYFELESKPLLLAESINANALLSSSSLTERERPCSHAVWQDVSADAGCFSDSTSSCESDFDGRCYARENHNEDRRGGGQAEEPSDERPQWQCSGHDSTALATAECPVCRCLALFDALACNELGLAQSETGGAAAWEDIDRLGHCIRLTRCLMHLTSEASQAPDV